MLILSRRDGESIQIDLDPNTPPNMTVAELFASGPMVVMVMGQHGKQTQIGIDAPMPLNVARSELVARSNLPPNYRS